MRLALLPILLLVLAAPMARAEVWKQGYTRQADQVLARGRAASGGKGWEYLRGWHEVGRENGVPYEAWFDPVRYGMRVEKRDGAGVDTHGFNGLGAWRITAAGAVTGTGDAAPVSVARTEAFYGVEGFFFSGRFDAAGRYLGPRKVGKRSFIAVEVKPYAGRARELWFDAKTGLLTRMVEHGADGKVVTTELNDYRKVGPIRVPFHAVTDDGAGGHVERVLESLTFAPADRDIFSLPRSTP
jgi:hypothetical protein